MATRIETVKDGAYTIAIVETAGRFVLLQQIGTEWHCDKVDGDSSNYASRSLDAAASYQRQHVVSYGRLEHARRAARRRVAS